MPYQFGYFYPTERLQVACMLQNYMPVSYHDMSMNMSFSKNEIARMYVFRKTANFRGAFVYRNGPKWAK